MKKYILFIHLIFSAIVFGQYTVNSISYDLYQANVNTVEFTIDDIFSDVINLPFDFEYFGNTYTEIIIGTNGRLSFDTSNANSFSDWDIENNYSLLGSGLANTINGVYHDMNNAVGTGVMYTSVVGVSPYRKFVVYFNNQPHFSCDNLISDFQVVLHESTNMIDVHINQKEICTWNGGRAVMGISNMDQTVAFSPPGRELFIEEVNDESWRYFYFGGTTPVIVCQTIDNTFTLTQALIDDILEPNDLPAGISVDLYSSESDALALTNPISIPYSNTLPFSLYTNVMLDGVIGEITFSGLDCTTDSDGDLLISSDEDLNGNGILTDDDTDGDGIPNFLDDDDDGDWLLTNYELVFTPSINTSDVEEIDTDGDGIPNHLDNDDDGDGILSRDEDTNGNGDYLDDDEDNDGIPDYLDNNNLGVDELNSQSNLIIYPNPVKDYIFIKENLGNTHLSIYSLNGKLVLEENVEITAENPISLSNLKPGVYLIQLQNEERMFSAKIIKE
jgi:hypothetical protein